MDFASEMLFLFINGENVHFRLVLSYLMDKDKTDDTACELNDM